MAGDDPDASSLIITYYHGAPLTAPAAADLARQAESRVVILVLTSLAAAFAAARVYTCAVLLGRRLYAEEWCILASVAVLAAAAALMMLSFASGMGLRRAALSAEQQVAARFWYLMGTPPSLLGVSVPKISVIQLLCRLFNPAQWHRIFMWSLGILCVLQFMAVSLVFVLGCKPVAASWDFTIRGASCIDAIEFVYYCYYASAFSTALDLYLAVYPATQLRRLSCSRKKKASLSAMLGLGVFSCVAAAYKTSILGLIADDDYTWSTTAPITWTAVEAAVIVISACIPTLHPLYERIYVLLKRLFTLHRHPTTTTATAQGGQPAGAPAAGQQPQPRSARLPRRGYWTKKIDSIVSTLLPMSVVLSSERSTDLSRWTATTGVRTAQQGIDTTITASSILEGTPPLTRPPDPADTIRPADTFVEPPPPTLTEDRMCERREACRSSGNVGGPEAHKDGD